jgi:hypothetical protein
VNTPLKISLLVVFSLIIAVFSALAITFYILPQKIAEPLTIEQKWSNYNNFEIVNGQKVPVGSASEDVVTPPPADTTEYVDPLPDSDTNQTAIIPGTSNTARAGKTKRVFNWNYQGQNFTLETWLENSLDYQGPASFTNEPEYYAKFLNTLPNDNSIKDVAQKLKAIGQAQRLTSDQVLELLIAFVQAIPYYSVPGVKFPYQTLMDGNGDCDDKSLLTYKLMSELDYGVALISFPKHMAVGVACPKASSLNNSGFTYLEVATLGKMAIGQIPPERVGQKYSLLLPKTGRKMYRSLANANA